MSSRVTLSYFSLIFTLIVFAIFITAGITTFLGDRYRFALIIGLILIVLFLSAVYAPLSIGCDEDYIFIKCILKRHKIRLEDIENIELFKPTMGARRICGSGGFMGYWGIFRENDIGIYTAYYGKASDCFLLRMKNGDKYVLGCKNPAEMAGYIESKIK